MKIEKFINWIQSDVFNNPNICFEMIKMIIDEFEQCLSKKEKIRWNKDIEVIREFSLTLIKDSIIEN